MRLIKNAPFVPFGVLPTTKQPQLNKQPFQSTNSTRQSLLWDSEHQHQQQNISQNANGVHYNHAGGGGVNVISGSGTGSLSPRRPSGSLHGHRTMSPPHQSALPKRSSFSTLQSHLNHPHHNNHHNHHQQQHSKGHRRHSAWSQMLVITL